MIYRKLGATGEKVSAIGLGGYHLGMPKDAEDAVRIVRSALDRGMNFLDNCWDYHDGESEIRMGRALRRRISPEGVSDDEVRRAHESSRRRSRSTNRSSACRRTIST